MTKLRYLICTLGLLLNGCGSGMLNPKGAIALEQKTLLIYAVSLMLVVVVPVIVMTFLFAWKYRATNSRVQYRPQWAHSNLLESLVWGISFTVIAILGTMAWRSAHQLDPYRPLPSQTTPLTIQVIALNWKWLFIYPQQNIAMINQVAIPVNVPVLFLITADAPMNSFAIPQLASQIYAMAGMQTKLNLIANEIGTYPGLSTNFSGAGFAGMHFNVDVFSQPNFEAWVSKIKQVPKKLTLHGYQHLSQPSENNTIQYYSAAETGIFNYSMMKYMMPMAAPEVKK